MKATLFAAFAVLVLAVTAGAAKAAPSGTISGPNEAGPYHYGNSVTFTTTSSGLKNAHPMIELACYQDTNGDGLNIDLFGPDLVWLQLDRPDSIWFSVGTYFDASQPATCVARLLAYGSKGQEQVITELDSVTFTAEP